MGHEEFVVVRSFSDAIAAELARARLESAGIPAHLGDEATVSVDWQLTNAVGGVRLRVAAVDADAARTILAAKLEPATPSAPGEALTPREECAERAAKVALFGLFFGPLLIYALWLIFRVLAEPGEMRASVRRQFHFAMILTFGALAAFLALMVFVLSR